MDVLNRDLLRHHSYRNLKENAGDYIMVGLAVLFLGAVIAKGVYETSKKYFSSQQTELKENGLERKIDSK